MVKYNTMQRRHYELVADGMKRALSRVPEDHMEIARGAMRGLACHIKAMNSNMNLERFYRAAGIEDSDTNTDTGSD